MKTCVYCPSHGSIHGCNPDGSVWCTTDDHVQLGEHESHSDAAAEGRRRGFWFYDDDTVTLRDSAIDPKPGDIVGDNRCIRLSAGRHKVYDIAYLREVVWVSGSSVEWRRPHRRSILSACSLKTWKRWASGSCRVTPEGRLVTERRR